MSAASSREQRLAATLAVIQGGRGAWSVGRLQRHRRAHGAPAQRSTARRDLAELARRGHLTQCGPHDGRYYTLRKDQPMSRRARRTHVDHAAVAAALRAQPGVWLTVGEYRNADTARTIRRRIEEGQRDVGRNYQPAGRYETRATLTDDGTLIEARYLPHLLPRRTPPAATALTQTDAARVTGQIARGEVLAGPEGARRIAARHETAYGDVWATDADRAWADAINDITAGGAS
ncbi:hypothetical protein DF268_08750 [Streptomyces sp. V2]|uniref:hypothetical protein n=1 Tax=Streptomyces sp. V2 TaxID=1424099 RepID=UPI000D66DF25|nr:hypothetical protein [Streptomyces sp. V2]PWG13943.1 hypothetical protein DF268_08750 [Streptomyces sp. V2]